MTYQSSHWWLDQRGIYKLRQGNLTSRGNPMMGHAWANLSFLLRSVKTIHTERKMYIVLGKAECYAKGHQDKSLACLSPLMVENLFDLVKPWTQEKKSLYYSNPNIFIDLPGLTCFPDSWALVTKLSRAFNTPAVRIYANPHREASSS